MIKGAGTTCSIGKLAYESLAPDQVTHWQIDFKQYQDFLSSSAALDRRRLEGPKYGA